MKVEILEERLSSNGFQGEKGDRFTVSDEVGTRWCEAGWAKDMDGKCATGERIPGAKELKITNIVTGVK